MSQLLRSDAAGYVLKDTSPEELARPYFRGGRAGVFQPATVSRVLLEDYVKSADGPAKPDGSEASDREKQVLRLVAQGKTSKEIAAQLKLSTRTVETYRVRLKRKLNARNVAELLSRARERGLV